MAQSNYKGPLDYIDVASRIVEFRTKYPDGSLQQQSLEFIDFAGGSWVVFTAAAYRTPEDTRPGVGTAWEPVPGKTNFTRDSELQNAETAAWGRAIVAALAADTKKGIASAEEVRNRQADRDRPVDNTDYGTLILTSTDEQSLRQVGQAIAAANIPDDKRTALRTQYDAKLKALREAS